MNDLPDRIRVPRHALAAWSRVRARLHESLDDRRLPGDVGPITDARIAAEMIGLCEVALGVGPGSILDPMLHPVYEAPPVSRQHKHRLTIEHDCSACGYVGPLNGPCHEYQFTEDGLVEVMRWPCPVCGRPVNGPTLEAAEEAR